MKQDLYQLHANTRATVALISIKYLCIKHSLQFPYAIGYCANVCAFRNITLRYIGALDRECISNILN